MDINHRCLEGGGVDPAGRKKNRTEGLTRKPGWVTKTVAARGGRKRDAKNKPLDNGREIATIVITKTCSLKTK